MRILLVILSVCGIISCSNVDESIYDEYIERPGADIEAELPQWDETPKTESDMIFDFNR